MLDQFPNSPYWDRNAWYPICDIKQVGSKPIRLIVLSLPIVVFRTESGKIAALLDVCPHRQAQLSAGRVHGENIQCPFHGWEFDAAGLCTNIPAIPKIRSHPRFSVPAFPVQEAAGLVWLYFGETDDSPPPSSPPKLLCPKEDSVLIHHHYKFEVATDLLSAIENSLDFTHAGFVHARTFRSVPTQRVKVEISKSDSHVEFRFLDEPKPKGLLFRLLSTGGEPFSHRDRFYPPAMIETVYEYGGITALQFREVMTPIDHQRTAVFGCLTAEPRPLIPKVLAACVLRSQGRKIISQDQRILQLVSENRSILNERKPAIVQSDLYYRYIKSCMVKNNAENDSKDTRTTEVLL
jgi:phenylpropionate dioxygenase-like ring-hydroxylating dioxygenase large terminal subunit